MAEENTEIEDSEEEEEVEEEDDCGDEKDDDEEVFPSVKTLSTNALDVQHVPYDWQNGYTEDWEFKDSDVCSECEKRVLITTPGEQEHCEANSDSNCQGYVSSDGPAMHGYWPLPSTRYDAKLLRGPLCLVVVGSDWGLALTGGGMNLSWEICEAYMRFGYLPPVAVNLSGRAGRGESDLDRWIIAGCREATRSMMRQSMINGRSTLQHLHRIEKEAAVRAKKS
jgi:hypothetical protein